MLLEQALHARYVTVTLTERLPMLLEQALHARYVTVTLTERLPMLLEQATAMDRPRHHSRTPPATHLTSTWHHDATSCRDVTSTRNRP